MVFESKMLTLIKLYRAVILNQHAVAPWGALRPFQGCCGVSRNVNIIKCENVICKIEGGVEFHLIDQIRDFQHNLL